ncbi:hypothetical protein Pogu_0630 [Pyrobaculum oguniense TE7]|uniref:Uncharacterized protein n=1 Tax=Pyrobaculum oguniense (strain DSM 13380 / JCM 10595 / TE7) TaxID=698757 RepID=H6Q800_PYROT|nr:hypothetical protein Pogu_0630 [Pyrobaculum oguniense TE7]
MPRRCNCREAARALVAAGYSYSQVAKMLGVSVKAVKKWAGEPPEGGAKARRGVAARGAQLPAGPSAMAERSTEAAQEAREAAPLSVAENQWVRLLRQLKEQKQR